MSIFDNELLPIKGLGTMVGSSFSTEAVSIADSGYVIKRDIHFGQLKRKPEESDKDYRERRIKDAFNFIRRELAKQRKAKSSLPFDIEAPEEFYFLGTDSDGYPAPFRIQKRVEGEKMRQVSLNGLTLDQKGSLKQLLKASLSLYRQSGEFLDLVGTTEGDQKGILPGLKKYLSPLQNSANIFLTKEGGIALVDVKTVRPPSLISGATMFLLLARCYWQEAMKIKLQQKIPSRKEQKRAEFATN